MVHEKKTVGINGNPITALLIPAGETNPNFPAATERDNAIIEFYDSRFKHTPHGQFTGGRYYLKTILDHNQQHGLMLNGDISAWMLSGESMLDVIDWAKATGVKS